ncbi:MAG: HAD family phosphatase [Puniceicoccales bacterium]|jgi:HAD superfamily hydrolase (TIGR01509 family)|nr:HAD family phosphatase [Puniceicoccales bacterium]
MHRSFRQTDSLRPPPGNFAAYIFDCDGTLAATMHLHHEAWLYAIKQQTGTAPDWDWDSFSSMGGMSIEDTVVILEKRFGFTLAVPAIIADTDAFLEKRLGSVEPCADALALAHEAAANGVLLAVASGGYRWRVEHTLHTIGATALFPVVVTSEDVARVKPAPDLFLLAARRLGVPPESCLVIEDSPRGRDAAIAAGMECLLVEPV